MQGYILECLVHMVFTIFVVPLSVFFLVRLEGDPISVMAPPTFGQAQIEALRVALGLVSTARSSSSIGSS